jgi:hypothetical protein
MAEKQVVFEPQDQLYIEGIVIDKDGDEALKFLQRLMERIKGTEGHVCGFRPFK